MSFFHYPWCLEWSFMDHDERMLQSSNLVTSSVFLQVDQIYCLGNFCVSTLDHWHAGMLRFWRRKIFWGYLMGTARWWPAVYSSSKVPHSLSNCRVSSITCTFPCFRPSFLRVVSVDFSWACIIRIMTRTLFSLIFSRWSSRWLANCRSCIPSECSESINGKVIMAQKTLNTWSS